MTTRPRILFASVAAGAVAATLLLAGCGKSASESAAEMAVSAATGGKVKVDKSGNQTTVTTDQGTAKIDTGGNLSVPKELPTDVHLPSVAYNVTNVIQMGPAITMTLHTTQPVSALFAEYDSSMKAAGWKEAMAMQSSQSQSLLSFQKDNRVVTVTLTSKSGSSDNGTDVTLQHVVQKPGG